VRIWIRRREAGEEDLDLGAEEEELGLGGGGGRS
jgi:hypothetical protein